MQIKTEKVFKESIVPKKGDLLLLAGKLHVIEDDGDNRYNLDVREIGEYGRSIVYEESVSTIFDAIRNVFGSQYEPELGVNYFPADRTTVTLTLGE